MKRCGALVTLTLCSVVASCLNDENRVPAQPEFYAHVQPILSRQCVQCHQRNGPAPFSLTTYQDVQQRAPLIAATVRARRMPPWLPDSSDYPFTDERRLSESEILTIERWAQQGAPPGAASRSPEHRDTTQWPLGKPDLILELRESYAVPNRAGDTFRNFVLPVPVQNQRFVRAVDIDPGNARVVHHLILSLDSTRTSRQEDARDAEPGFDGMFSRHAARPPAGFFVGWTPGRVPRINAEGLAWPLRPGDDVVLQMHLRAHGLAGETILPRVALYFAERPALRTPLLIRLGSQTIDIPPNAGAYEVSDSVVLPVAVEALGLYPHAHYLAKTMTVSAQSPNGDRNTLLQIDDWDFNWQDAYSFKEPVPLAAGTVIRLRYTYDNSAGNLHNPNQPPKRVVYGPNSTDEMAELWLQVVPRREGDVTALQQALALKSARDRVQGWQHLIKLDPNDATAHASLASHYSRVGDRGRALEHYQRAVQSQPDFASAHYNLALLMEEDGNFRQAADHYQAAVRARPDHTGAHNNLGNVLIALKRRQEAALHFRQAIALDSTQAEPHNNLGRLLTQMGNTEQAIVHFRKAIALEPRTAAPRFNLALALASIGRTAEALQEFDAGIQLRPQALDAYLPLAWLLATHPSKDVRRPQQAVLLAERAAQTHGRPHPQIADVLAAAYASVGDFARALEFAHVARQLAQAAHDTAATSAIEERIKLYERRRSYINPRP